MPVGFLGSRSRTGPAPPPLAPSGASAETQETPLKNIPMLRFVSTINMHPLWEGRQARVKKITDLSQKPILLVCHKTYQ